MTTTPKKNFLRDIFFRPHQKIILILSFLLPVFFCKNLFAQNFSNAKIFLDLERNLEIEYSTPPWNKDPQRIEKFNLFLRDQASGEIVSVELKETSADSGVFRAKTKLKMDQAQRFFTPEIYIAPQTFAKSKASSTEKIQQWVTQGKIPRSPIFLHPIDSQTQAITVYDSKDQAYSQFEGYKKLLYEKRAMEAAAIDAEAALDRENERKRLQMLADEAEKKRLDFQIQEQKRKADLLAQQAALDEKTKQLRRDQARRLAEEALILYKQENYLLAEEKFNQAVELDPQNLDYYFQFGVTLYKNKKYNPSIVVLKALESATENRVSNVAQKNQFDVIEKQYYLGLDFLKLNDGTNAQGYFETVLHEKAHALAPYAAFFLGVILFQAEKYDPSQKNFEFVLDQSKDPEMDRQAETYIDRIANIKQFLLLKSHRWSAYLNVGLMYDSNILSASTGTASDNAGWRLSYGGSLSYRLIYLEKTEWAAKVLISDLNSVFGNTFKVNDNLQRYDPMLTQFSAPFSRRGSLLGKPFQWTLTPAYEFTYMDVDGLNNDGFGTNSYALRNRELITNSLSVKSDQTLVMSNRWFSNYSLEYRRDLSFTSVGDEERQTANKYALGTTQTFFKNSKRNKGQIIDATYTINQALGQNQSFTRYDLGWAYTAPAWRENTWNFRIGGAYAKYSKHLIGRADTEASIGGGLRMPLSKSWISNLLGSFSNVRSSLSGYSYNKYFILSQFEYSTQF